MSKTPYDVKHLTAASRFNANNKKTVKHCRSQTDFCMYYDTQVFDQIQCNIFSSSFSKLILFETERGIMSMILMSEEKTRQIQKYFKELFA